MITRKRRQSLRLDVLLIQHLEVWVEQTRAKIVEVLRAKGAWAQKFTASAVPPVFAGLEGLILDGDER